jgi:hypothetical protein
MRRRDFITLLGGGAASWPLAAWAQDNRMRRMGVLMNLASDGAEGQVRLAAFHQGLQQLGWPSAGMCRSTIAGARAMPIAFANSRRNWSRWRLMSSCRPAVPAPRRSRRPAQCPSCS